MDSNIVGIGYENYVDRKRIIAVLNVNSSPAKRLVHQAEERGILIDVTAGRKRKSVIIMDSNHIFITAKNPSTIIDRLIGEETEGR